METKTLSVPLQIKAISDKGEFSGYGSVFDTVDAYRERVAKGAFLDSLAEHQERGTMPALLWQHNPRDPIGVYDAIKEDDHGLYMEGRLNLEIPEGKRAHSLLNMTSKANNARAIGGMSIGFVPRKWEYSEDEEVLTLLAVDLWETSIVTFPANPDAQVESVKSLLRTGKFPTVRDFEGFLMRDAGFTRSQARMILNQGYKTLVTQDADDGELEAFGKQLDQLLQRANP